MYYSFIDTGTMFCGGIMLCVILLITLTLYVRIGEQTILRWLYAVF